MATFIETKKIIALFQKGKLSRIIPYLIRCLDSWAFDSQGSIYEGQTDSTDLVEIVDEEQEALNLLKAKDFDPRNFMNDLSGNSQKSAQ